MEDERGDMLKLRILKARAILGVLLFCVAIVMSLRGGGESVFAGYYTASVAFLQNAVPIIGLNDIIFTPSSENFLPRQRRQLEPLSEEYIEQLSDFNYLSRTIFLADPRTRFLPSDVNVREFLAKEQVIDTTVDGPQVLIFHAHSMEMFVDSDPRDPMTGVFGVGAYLAEILSRDFGLEVMHHMARFDMVNGLPNMPGSYERLAPVISQIISENPSIQLVIDLHRDGVGEHVSPMVTYIDGIRTAQIMFVNGLQRRYRNGITTNLYHLPNPHQRDNLAFTLNLQLAANQLYPGLARRAYLLEFRYSLHMHPNSMLLEVGAQNNTFQEALNAMHPMANIIAAVMLGE
jgi:stage II sporulation protein P